MGFVALLVRIKLGSPVLFRQERPGRNGEPFTLVKFRSMTNERDENGELLPDEQRLTRFGKLLRSTSLDELPELFNVIKGEMSLVGPRPLLVRYLPYFSTRERKRFDVLPGITGMAQINGRNNLAWDQRFKHDVWYVEHCSVATDIKIMAQTLVKVVRREDIAEVPGVALDEERADWHVETIVEH
jgi:lipopolysaccharide/colanic/teichoic acid biosynthesis glycosyltransferase